MEQRVEAFEISSEDEMRDVLERIDRVLEGRALAPKTERRRYLDTFDWRIHRSGSWLCETPRRDRTTLHWSSNGHVPLSVEAKRSPDFIEELPDGPIRAELEPIVAPRRLMPIADVSRRSQTVELLDEENKVVCRVTAVTSALRGDSETAPTHKLVLEGVRGYPDEYQVVERFLRYQLRLPVSGSREIDRIIDGLGDDAGKNPSALRADLSADMTGGEAVRLVLATLCDVLVLNRGGVLQALDTEFLHDFRVAVRRSRSILSQVGDVLPKAAVEHYGKELRWLGGLIGPARDLDVFLLQLPVHMRTLPARDATALQSLEKTIRADRKEQQKKLCAALEGDRFNRFIANWKSFLLEPAAATHEVARATTGHMVLYLADDSIWLRYRKVRRAGRRIGPKTPAGELHSLRIQCKKLRYLLEAFRSLYPKGPVSTCIKELKRLQNTLGDFNDAQVHAKMLRALAERVGAQAPGSSDAVVAIGVLVSALADRREEQRQKFFERFERFAAPANHARFRTLFKDAERDE